MTHRKTHSLGRTEQRQTNIRPKASARPLQPMSCATNGCPICLESWATVCSEVTPCGHVYCTTCLTKWRHAGHDTCPLCRTSLREASPSPPPPPPPRTATPAAVGAVSRERQGHYAEQEFAEREHAERAARRSRQVQLERRLDQYRSSIFTPSGRPFDELPVVSLGQLRKTLRQNARALYPSQSERDQPSLFRRPPCMSP